MTITFTSTTLKRVLYGVAAAGAIAAAGVSFALAQEEVRDEDISQEAAAKIQFPVAELGNCADKAACKAYCDGPANRRACFAFAKKHGLMKEEKVRKIEKRLKALETKGGGPGGCQEEQSCEAYCSDVKNMRECIAFAKENGVMDERELAEAEKVQAAVERGARLPGGCRNKQACETHCSNPDNLEECVAFAEQAGFMDKQELQEMKRVLPLMKRGETPGGCRGRQQCETYCDNPDHLDECVAFAEKAGLIDKKELEMIKKTGGRGPGGCRGKIECETYCDNPDNTQQCFKFAEEHGLISPEELEQIKKAGGAEFLKQGGPGGCRGKRECEDFCKNPENQEACFAFAVEKGLIPPEEAEKIKQRGGPQAFNGPGGCVGPRECEEYCSQEDRQEECMEFFGGGPGGPGGPPDDEGGFPGGPPPGLEEDFDQEAGEGGSGEGARLPRPGAPVFGIPGLAGPGGCKGPQACFEFCRNPKNLEACRQFAPESRGKRDRAKEEERDFDREDGEVEDNFDQEGDEGDEGDKEHPARGEFPGRGEPTEGFLPPPGFGEGAPPKREEGFETPPGFAPPGVRERFNDGSAGGAPEGGASNAEIQRQIESRTRAEFETRDQESRARFETQIRERPPEFREQKGGGFTPPAGQVDRSAGVEPRSPESMQMQRPAEQFNAPPGGFEPPQPRPSSSTPLRIARKLLGTLGALMGF